MGWRQVIECSLRTRRCPQGRSQGGRHGDDGPLSSCSSRVHGRPPYNDFSAILAKDRAAKPEHHQVHNLVVVGHLGTDAWDSRDLDVRAADGGYYTNHYDPSDPRSEVRSFLKAYGEKYRDGTGGARVPDAIAVLTYDAANLLLTAIAAAGTEDTDRVKQALVVDSFVSP